MTPQRIFLVGLPGSGKSTTGAILAERLGWPFVDLDAALAAQAGEPVSAIFARGEAEFRQREAALLREVAQQEPVIIATGGGAVIDPANRQVMHDSGITIWLQVAPDVALARLAADGVERPLLRGDVRANFMRLQMERAALYAEASLTVTTADRAPAEVAQHILAQLVGAGFFARNIPPTMISVPLPATPHAITIAVGLAGQLAAAIHELRLPPRLTIITDAHVGELYLADIQAHLRDAGIGARVITVPAGEASKSLQQLGAIYDQLIELRHERGEAIIALGGGVVGDLAGFAAATYLRGVPVIQVPTTLLAMVDSAIGGKTGINHPRAKNAIGAFYQPRAVLIDPAYLLTLDGRLFREGFGEIVKYGMGLDAELFADLEAQGAALLAPDLARITPIIARCAQIKADIISADERESHRRMLLNYGHTIGHALEAVTGYGALLHGEAVFLGMAVEARIAVEIGLLAPDAVARQDALSAIFQPPPLPRNIAPEAILAATRLDKKARGGRVQWILPDGIGSLTIRDDVPDQIVLALLTDWLAK